MSDNLKSVTMTDELAKAVNAAMDPADLKAAILAEAEKQGLAADTLATEQATAEKAAADKTAADKVIADAATAKTTFSRTEVISGKEFTFEGDSEQEVNQMALNAYRVAATIQTPARVAPPIDPAIAAAAAQKAAEEEAANKAELELKFKRGDISTAEYIEQSGAMDAYLAKKGVPLSALQAVIEKDQNTQYEKSWMQATEEFKRSVAGADWPGGEQNKNILGMKIVAMGLTDADDKVAALAAAYADMKATNMIFPVERAAVTLSPADQAIAEATAKAAKVSADNAAATAVVAEAARVAALRQPAKSSSIFGASSGVNTPAADKSATPTVEVPKDATPEEIIDAWKKTVVASGQSPDSAFQSQFSARRA